MVSSSRRGGAHGAGRGLTRKAHSRQRARFMSLSPNQRRFLCAKAHPLKAIVRVGQSGLTQTLDEALGKALYDHELVKVKFGQSFPGTARDHAQELAQRVNAEVCQVLGRVVTLYKSRGKPVKGKVSIELPVSSE